MSNELTVLSAPQVPAHTDQPIVVDELVTNSGTFGHYAIADIRISKTNRKRFNLVKLNELAASIKAKGVAQPILIRPVTPTEEEPQSYEVVAGERRYRASIIAGIPVIPAMCRVLSDMEALELQILENLQRDDPHPLEEAEGYERLMMKHGYNADQLAEKLDKSRSYIYGRLKLCALNLDVREQFLDNQEHLPASTALLIARIPVASLQSQAVREILRPNGLPTDDPMSFRKAKQWIQDKYMLDLKKAVFVIKDAKLLPDAGSCVACPKRAGNQPVVFEGIQADTCTDPDCFQEKTAAHYIKLAAQAKKQGIPVHEGEDASEVWSVIYRRGSTLVGSDTPIYTFDRVTPGTGMAGYVRNYLKKDQRPPVVAYVKGSDGVLEELYDRDGTQLALEAVGTCESEATREARTAADGDATTASIKKQTQSEQARIATEAAQAERAEQLTTERVNLYKKVRAAGANGFQLGTLREVAKQMLNEYSLPDDLLTDTYALTERADAAVRAYIDQVSYSEVQQIIVDLVCGNWLCVEHWHLDEDGELEEDQDDDNFKGYQTLLRMAKHEGVLNDGSATPPAAEPEEVQRTKITLKPKADQPTEPSADGQPIIKIKKNRALSIATAAEGMPT